MANFRFLTMAKELQEAQEEGVTFENLNLTWDTAEDVKDVVAALETKKLVHFLKLEGNTLGVDAAAAIGKALEKHPEFRSALWNSCFTRRLKTEIPQALKHLGNGLIMANAQLSVLDLSDNALGPNGMVGLEVLLRSTVCYSLQELRLNNCGLGIGGAQMLSKALLDCHSTSTAAGTPLKLKVFIAGRNRMENDGAKAVAKIFSTLKTLEHIAMPQNSIYHIGIAALADGIKENQNLQILNLNDNTVTAKGAASLADTFRHTPHLREINFGDCLLKTNGAYELAHALQEHHTQLEVADFSYNEIGTDGGKILVNAMLNKPILKRLNLDGNQFGEQGHDSIIAAMSVALKPEALENMEENQSEGEENEDYHEGGEDEDGLYGEDNIYEYDEAYNDTTEEADEDEYEYEDESEDTAYATTQDFPTNTMNESLTSFKSTFSTMVPQTTATTPVTLSTSRSNNAESFCLIQKPCSLQMFELINANNKLEAFKSVFDQFSGDNYLLVLIFTTLKCANLSEESVEALELAMDLYIECFEYALKVKQERRVLNYILIQLGLLRCEEKFNAAYNSKGCRFALRETLKKKTMPTDYIKNVCTVLLENIDV